MGEGPGGDAGLALHCVNAQRLKTELWHRIDSTLNFASMSQLLSLVLNKIPVLMELMF